TSVTSTTFLLLCLK
ncbi:semialdehyde dehydrogenase, NAD binding domain protein, partial [Vibrio parahaemolyticus V-223/04]